MAKTDTRIDAYIDKAAAFARPILDHLRSLVHVACPEVEETMKWSFPHFDYKGNMMCSMASFKQHCSFGFWNAAIMKSAEGIIETGDRSGMGHLGKITTMKDLPSDKTMIKMIKEACKLNDAGIKTPRMKPLKTDKKDLVIVPELIKALSKNKTAKKYFDTGSYSFQKEYNQWIEEAKSEATRDSRIVTAIEWIAEGKGRNWKYERPKK
ncbi:MAG: DUF1801 domain-containing protein [Saprospiraceae bacterium]